MKKYILRIALCAVMLALAVFAAVFTAGNSLEELAWVTLDSEVVFFSANGEVCRLPHGLTVEGKSSGKYTAYYSSSLDGRFVAVIASHNAKTGGTLYRVDSRGAQLLAEGVCRAVISDDGDRVAYIQKNGDRSGSLYLYDHSSRSHQLLEAQATPAAVAHRLAISPDGETVAYRRAAGKDSVTTVWNRGEYHELGEDVVILAVADNMTPFYYFRSELRPVSGSTVYNYYVRNGETDTIITTDHGQKHFFYNRDYTEAYIEDRIFIDAAGGVHEVPYTFREFAVPVTEQRFSTFSPELYYYFSRFDTEHFSDMPVGAFTNDGYTVGRINADYTFSPVITAPNYQYVYFDNGALALQQPFIRISSDEKPNGDILIKGAFSFAAAPDFSYLYYLDLNEDLYYCPMNDDGEPTLVATDATVKMLNKNNFSYTYHTACHALVNEVLYFSTVDEETRLSRLHMARGSSMETIFVPEHGYFDIFELGDDLILYNIYRRDELTHCDFYRLTPKGLTLLSQVVSTYTYFW